MELTLKDVETLVKLVTKESLDVLEFADLKIVKTKHLPKIEASPQKSELSREESLYGAGAPQLSPEEEVIVVRNKRRQKQDVE